MEKTKLIMDILYSEYGSILEANCYKANKLKSKYKLKTKDSLSEVNFLFLQRSDILHLVYSYTNLEVEKLHKKSENKFLAKEGANELKVPRPSFIITDWKNILTLYGCNYRNLNGWFFKIKSIDNLEERIKDTYSKAIEIIIDLNKKLETPDGLLDILFKNNELNEYLDVYDAINILATGKLISEECLLSSYSKITSCIQYKNITKESKLEIEKYFNELMIIDK